MYSNFRNLTLYVFPIKVKNWSTSAQNAKIDAVYLKKEAQKAIVSEEWINAYSKKPALYFTSTSKRLLFIQAKFLQIPTFLIWNHDF